MNIQLDKLSQSEHTSVTGAQIKKANITRAQNPPSSPLPVTVYPKAITLLTSNP